MTRALLLLFCCWLPVASVLAAELPLPPGATDLPRQIADTCPTCAATGYTPCGSPDVAWGRRFATTALLGTPKRAYLLTFTMTGDMFRNLARTNDYDALVATLRERFAHARLVVIENDFTRARVLAEPTRVEVTFPTPLHTCVHTTDHPWGCCISDCKEECCEKSLGSPRIDLEWQDRDEHLHLHFTHTTGTTWLKRKHTGHDTLYYCLTDAKGTLKVR